MTKCPSINIIITIDHQPPTCRSTRPPAHSSSPFACQPTHLVHPSACPPVQHTRPPAHYASHAISMK